MKTALKAHGIDTHRGGPCHNLGQVILNLVFRLCGALSAHSSHCTLFFCFSRGVAPVWYAKRRWRGETQAQHAEVHPFRPGMNSNMHTLKCELKRNAESDCGSGPFEFSLQAVCLD